MRGMLMADFNRPAEALASFERAVALQARLQQGALGRHARRRCRSSTPRKPRSPRSRADYERRLRALSPSYEAGQIPGDMSKGLGTGAAVLPRLSGPKRPRPAAPVRRPCLADHGRPLRRGRDRSAAGAGRAHPRRHRQRLLLSALGLEDRRQGLGHASSIAKRFQVFGYHTGCEQDAETAVAREHCHRFVQGPLSIERWRQIILADRPHVLYYPGHRHERRSVRAGRASARAGAMRLHRPSADQRLSDHRLFPQRRIDRAARRRASITPKSW